VQSVFPLPPGLGALKVTTALFFRPGGASTQASGVASDVVVPSPFNLDVFGEKRQPRSLPPQSVPPFPSASANGAGPDRWEPVAPQTVAALRARSAARQKGDSELQKVREDLAERAKDDGVLEIAEVLKPGGEAPAGSAQAQVDAGVAASAPGGDTAATEDSAGRARAERDEPTPQLKEALRVLGDLVALQAGGAGSVAEAAPPR
jgi:hypothetical protein